MFFLVKMGVSISNSKYLPFKYPNIFHETMVMGERVRPRSLTSPLKMDGWKTMLSYWEGNFSGAFPVKLREGKLFSESHLCGNRASPQCQPPKR